MTECTSKSMSFSSAGRSEVVADFLGGRLTSDAGVLLLREINQKIGLLDALNAAIPDPRDPRMTVHRQRTMLTQGKAAKGAKGSKGKGSKGDTHILKSSLEDKAAKGTPIF